MQKERIIIPGQNVPVDERNAVERRLHRLHNLMAIARVAARRVGFFAPFAAARVPARCASSALPQQNIFIISPGAHSSL